MVVAVVALLLLVAGDRIERPPPRPATLAAYWAGEARWQLAAKWTSTDIGQPDPYSGAHLEIVGDRWYLFNRGRRPGTCPDGEFRVGVQVRESADRGRTWSAPVMAIEPAPGTPWSCAASDGDAVYEPATRTWRYLFQCKTDGGSWNGCYAERIAASPMGRFAAPTGNPVIRSGDLWGAICDAGDDCAGRPVGGEGTFNIFHRDRSGYWISFHGWDGARAFRGVAKTADFRSFVADRPDAGVPPDAILDDGDADGFRERWVGGRSVGAGAGTIAVEDGRFYALNEFADISLGCTDGQNWDLGLFRSASPASTAWEPFPGGNPIVASSHAAEAAGGRSAGCNVLYPSLFRDPATGGWYLMHGRSSANPAYHGIYLYRLVRDESALVNEDFASGDARGWVASAGLRLTVPRLPNGSPDGTRFLSFGCGGPGCGSVHQDVPVAGAPAGFAFGGSFRAESGSGAIRLAVQQLDQRGRVVRDDAMRFTVGPEYRRVRGSGTVAEEARVLRYGLSPAGGGTYGADNLFLTLAR